MGICGVYRCRICFKEVRITNMKHVTEGTLKEEVGTRDKTLGLGVLE